MHLKSSAARDEDKLRTLGEKDSNEKFGNDVQESICNFLRLGRCRGRSSRWNRFPNEAAHTLPLNVGNVAPF